MTHAATATLPASAPAPVAPVALSWLHRALRALAGVPAAPRSADDLLALAAHYESTQPSYAADLRAAAGASPDAR